MPITTPQRRRPLGRIVHEWLSEEEGQTFELGKWRFWFIAVAGLQILNALLTALIFQSSGNLQNYMGAVLLGVGALVGWLAIGALHYSGASDRKLSRGVSILDSITLLFVIAHFAFLMWAYGHLKTIQSAEAKYEAVALIYNTRADKVSGDNVEIAKAGIIIAQETRKTEKLKNDTAYQTRKTAEITGHAPASRSGAAGPLSPSLSTSNVELEKPTKPEQSSAKFLTDWDAWIRAANFGELLLCALTLIFIRNRTASQNMPRPQVFRSVVVEDDNKEAKIEGEFPPELDTWNHPDNLVVRMKTNRNIPEEFRQDLLSVGSSEKYPVLSNRDLSNLRHALRDVAHYLPKQGFKADISGDGVIVRQFSYDDEEKTIHSVKFSPEQCEEFLRLRITRQFQFLAKLGFAVRDDITRYVYFIRRKGTDEIKIGISDAPENRLLQLQGGQGQELELVRTLPGNLGLEKRLHRHFKDRHLTGEWFKLSQTEIDAVVKKIERRLASGKAL